MALPEEVRSVELRLIMTWIQAPFKNLVGNATKTVESIQGHQEVANTMIDLRAQQIQYLTSRLEATERYASVQDDRMDP